MGFDFWAYEIDKKYFEGQEKRFRTVQSATKTFRMIDLKDLRLLKLSEVEKMGDKNIFPIPAILYRKDGEVFRTVSITEEDMKSHPKVTKAVTKFYCEEKRMYLRLNRPFKSFI